MQDKNPLAHYSGVLSEAVQESAAVTGKTARPIAPEFNLKTSAGGRGYVSWYFSNIMQRHDFGNYITKTLAADFACSLASWLRDGKPRVESQAAPAVVAVPDERAAFESWALRCAVNVMYCEPDNQYLKTSTELLWQCWQARAALAATPAAAQEHELIDWDSAHKIVFQAAAAFRPSYFNGAGFVAHNWVVEAIRSGHIDGQRHALGLPPIDRSGAHAAELRTDRKAATPAAAAPVVLTEQDAILLNQAIELLEDLSGEKRRRGEDSTAEGAACSAHAVQRLGAALLAGVSAPAAGCECVNCANGMGECHSAPQAQEAAGDAERDGQERDTLRLDYLIEAKAEVCNDETCADGYWLQFCKKDGTRWVQLGEYETARDAIDAAIAAAKGE